MSVSIQVPTKAELAVREELEKYDLNPLYDRVYCFKCSDYFLWQNKFPPEYCVIDGDDLGKGEYCRPDIMLERWIIEQDWVDRRLAVIYVNGKIHGKRRQNMRDWNQIQELLNRNIQVYVILNEDIIDGKAKTDKKSKEGKATKAKIKTEARRATVKRIRDCFNDDSGAKYEEYKRGKEFQERVRKY